MRIKEIITMFKRLDIEMYKLLLMAMEIYRDNTMDITKIMVKKDNTIEVSYFEY